jgi:hypothetical protein
MIVDRLGEGLCPKRDARWIISTRGVRGQDKRADALGMSESKLQRRGGPHGETGHHHRLRHLRSVQEGFHV